MAILSAQCTDARVNLVSGPLFARFPDARSIAESREGELEELIRSVGLYNSKAKNIRRCCRTLVDEFGGEIPEAMEDLLRSAASAGRLRTSSAATCSASAVLWRTHTAYALPISSAASSKDPVKVERQLEVLVPRQRQTDFCHRLVHFGRDCCIARAPRCDACVLADCCDACQKGESA